MSLVICFATSDYSMIVSDGRRCNVADNSIVDGFYDKTRRINKNVILGYTGSTETCESILSAFDSTARDNKIKDSITVNETTDIILRTISNMPLQGKEYSFIISGINNRNKIEIDSFSSKNNNAIEKYNPNGLNYYYSILYSNNISKEIVDRKISKYLSSAKFNTIYDKLIATIKDVAKFDKTVNTNCFSKMVSTMHFY